MKPARLPADPGGPPADREEIRTIQVGEKATLHLKSGKKIEGEVTAIAPDRITLGRPSNYGYQEDTYLEAEIERMETSRSTGFGRFAGGLVGGVAITFAVLITLLFIFPPDFSGLD